MNTKTIPIIITLIAAAISSLTSVIQRVSFDIFTKRLVISVICFAIIGCIVRVVVERSFPVMEPEENEEGLESEEEEQLEDISSQDESEQ